LIKNQIWRHIEYGVSKSFKFPQEICDKDIKFSAHDVYSRVSGITLTSGTLLKSQNIKKSSGLKILGSRKPKDLRSFGSHHHDRLALEWTAVAMIP
jgi:hypothetical protein